MVKHKHLSIKRILPLVLILSVLSGAIVTYKYFSGREAAHSSDDNSSSINYGPPTEEEKSAGDRMKQQISDDGRVQDEVSSSENPNKKSIGLLITDAGQYGDLIEVRAFTDDALEDGECSIRFTGPGTTLTKKAPAYADASTTICTVPEIKRSEFTKAGTWNVEVTFSSEHYIGSSSREVTIR